MIRLSSRQILDAYLEGCKNVEQELSNVSLEKISGEIPPKLQGYLFRNGVGRYENYGIKYQHPFDGDGMITRFHFQSNQIFYSNRYVRTQEFLAEEKAQKMLFRSFGTNIPGGFLKNFLKMQFKNAANTSLIYHGGKLLALWEGGLPHLIDPHSLDTLARYDYEGTLQNPFSSLERFISPELAFSAHPKIHPHTGEMHNFGLYSGKQSRIMNYVISPQGKAQKPTSFDIPHLSFIHDFVLTENYRIFFVPAVSFDMFRTFVGIKTPVASINSRPNSPTAIYVLGKGEPIQLEVPHGFIFHFTNAYEEDEHTIIVDGLRMERFPSADTAQDMMNGEDFQNIPAYLTRYYIDLPKKSIKHEQISDYPLELPDINPQKSSRPYRFAWGIGNRPSESGSLLHGIVKVDCQMKQSWMQDFYPHLPGEPIFVPDPQNPSSEDAGYLITLVYDIEQVCTFLIILNAQDLTTLAKYKLPHPIPLGFHGTWVEQLEN